MVKIKKTLFYSLLMFCLMFIVSTEKTYALTDDEVLNFLEKEYKGFFYHGGELKSQQYNFPVNMSKYQQEKLIYYGNSQTAIGNSKLRGVYRYSGHTFSDEVFLNPNAELDAGLKGDLKNRRYVTNPFAKAREGTLRNSSYKPRNENFNDIDKLVWYFMKSGKIYTKQEVKEIKQMWLSNLDDEYDMADPWDRSWDYFRSVSEGYWVERTNNNNQWDSFSMSKKESFVHILQPPTEFTRGIFVEFHEVYVGRRYRDYYDLHYINPLLQGDNLKATKLEVNEIAPNTFEVFFTVKNVSNRKINVEEDLPSLITVDVGGQKLEFEATGWGVEWDKDKSRRVHIGSFNIPFTVAEGTPVTVSANYNYEETFEETTYADNKLTKKVFTEKAPVCTVGGGNENKLYTVRVTDYSRPVTNTYTDSFGNTSSYISYPYTIFEERYAYLTHSAIATYNSNKQILVGVWSRNSKGHDSMTNVPLAYNVDLPKEDFKVKINHNVPGIIDLRRVIRSGRAVELYSTMEIDLRIMSFDGDGDIESRKNNFMNHLINTLKVNGVDLGSEEIINNLKKSEAKGQKDDLRKMSTSSTPTIIENFGDADGIQIKRYDKSYKIILPIKSKNEGGTSDTNQGSFANDIPYSVAQGVAEFYTHINNKNGLHGLQFIADIDGSKIGSGVGQMLCKSKTEVFGIQGNMFDDVRAEETNNHDDDWDF